MTKLKGGRFLGKKYLIINRTEEKRKEIEKISLEIHEWYRNNKNEIDKKIGDCLYYIHFSSYNSYLDDNSFFSGHLEQWFPDYYKKNEDVFENIDLIDGFKKVIKDFGVEEFFLIPLRKGASTYNFFEFEFDSYPKDHFECGMEKYSQMIGCILNLKRLKLEFYTPDYNSEPVFTCDVVKGYDYWQPKLCEALHKKYPDKFHY